MEYKIKITGSGTREQIAKDLRHLADAIHHPTSKGDGLNIDLGEAVELQDKTLLAEISKS